MSQQTANKMPLSARNVLKFFREVHQDGLIKGLTVHEIAEKAFTQNARRAVTLLEELGYLVILKEDAKRGTRVGQSYRLLEKALES